MAKTILNIKNSYNPDRVISTLSPGDFFKYNGYDYIVTDLYSIKKGINQSSVLKLMTGKIINMDCDTVVRFISHVDITFK